MRRFFRSSPEIYESIRLAMDSVGGFPSDKADTWFPPESIAIKDVDGNCLISAIYEIAEEFLKSNAEEITFDEYMNSIALD